MHPICNSLLDWYVTCDLSLTNQSEILLWLVHTGVDVEVDKKSPAPATKSRRRLFDDFDARVDETVQMGWVP